MNLVALSVAGFDVSRLNHAEVVIRVGMPSRVVSKSTKS